MPAELYDRLGLSSSADADEIREAFRRMVREHHPDGARDDADRAAREAIMKRLNEAYDILGDGPARLAYDRALGLNRLGVRRVYHSRLRRRRVRGLGGSSAWERFVPSAADSLTETRLGQWLLVLLAAAVGSVALGLTHTALDILLRLAPAGLLALLLARGGTPTPLSDSLELTNAVALALVARLRRWRDSVTQAVLRSYASTRR